MGMISELDEVEKAALLDMVIERARADLNDGKPLTEMRQVSPSEGRMAQLIGICDRAASDESPEYVVACALLNAAEQSGFAPDGDDFELRVRQRKVFIGRAIEAIRGQGKPKSEPSALVELLRRKEQ